MPKVYAGDLNNKTEIRNITGTFCVSHLESLYVECGGPSTFVCKLVCGEVSTQPHRLSDGPLLHPPTATDRRHSFLVCGLDVFIIFYAYLISLLSDTLSSIHSMCDCRVVRHMKHDIGPFLPFFSTPEYTIFS